MTLTELKQQARIRTDSFTILTRAPALIKVINHILDLPNPNDKQVRILQHFVESDNKTLHNTVYFRDEIYSPCTKRGYTYNLGAKKYAKTHS